KRWKPSKTRCASTSGRSPRWMTGSASSCTRSRNGPSQGPGRGRRARLGDLWAEGPAPGQTTLRKGGVLLGPEGAAPGDGGGLGGASRPGGRLWDKPVEG